MKAEAIPAHLGSKSPPHAWEGCFLIAIFPRESTLRWCKVQLFSGGRNPGRHCLSSVEGMDGDGQVLVLTASAREVNRHELRFAPGGMQVARDGWEVRAPGIDWRGSWPDTRLVCDTPTVRAKTHVDDVLWWVKIPRVLSYWSAFGAIEWDGTRGAALVEHAWGTDSPLDFSRLPPRRWQWDVLAFDDGNVCAGLSIDLGAGLYGIRGGGTLPGRAFTSGATTRVVHRTTRHEEGRTVPDTWAGTMRIGGSELRYEARAATPVAPVVPSGGFLGFDFDGECSGLPVRGTGFCEYRL